MEEELEKLGIWGRIRRFLEPETAGETAALVGTSMIPGVGTALDAADIAAGIQDRDPVRVGIGTLAAALPFVSAASLRGLGRGITSNVRGLLKAPPRIRAYHGSPHDFDSFRWGDEVRGTGEGAQAFGDGIYLAESPEVGQRYRDMAGKTQYLYDNRELPDLVATRIAAGFEPDAAARAAIPEIMKEIDDYKYFIDTKDTAIRFLKNSLQSPVAKELGQERLEAAQRDLRLAERSRDMWMNKLRTSEDSLNLLEEIKSNGFDFDKLNIVGGGKLYTVDINADRADFLDLNRPLGEQPEWIQNVFPGRVRDLGSGEAIKNIVNGRPPREMWDAGEPVTVSSGIVQPKSSVADLDSAVDEIVKEMEKAEGLNPDAFMDRWIHIRNHPKMYEEVLAKHGYSRKAGLGPENKIRMRGIGGLMDRRAHNFPALISQELRKHGIPGIKFYDGFSRSAGKGTRNFVIFDPDLIEIVDKKAKGGTV